MNLEELKELIVSHLTDVISGECKITREQLEKEPDPATCEILAGILCLHEDLALKESQRQKAEKAVNEMVDQLRERNDQLVENQKKLEALAAELATPLIGVWKGTLLMPLVGSVDAARAQDIMTKVLAAISSSNTNHIILDLTGVHAIDATTADHLVRIVSSIRVLGAGAIVAGAQPGVASAIVATGVDLRDVTTVRNVQAALDLVMGMGRATVPSSRRKPSGRAASGA